MKDFLTMTPTHPPHYTSALLFAYALGDGTLELPELALA